ncbi:MAG: transcriptional repressor [Asticcacaulis sp.]
MMTKEAQLLEVLRQAQRPLSAYALLPLLHRYGFAAPVQVYRTLEKLIASGQVRRLESVNAYILSEGKGAPQAWEAYAICRMCGQVESFTDEALSGILSRWADKRVFTPEKSVIEIHGRCVICTSDMDAQTEQKD